MLFRAGCPRHLFLVYTRYLLQTIPGTVDQGAVTRGHGGVARLRFRGNIRVVGRRGLLVVIKNHRLLLTVVRALTVFLTHKSYQEDPRYYMYGILLKYKIYHGFCGGPGSWVVCTFFSRLLYAYRTLMIIQQ